MLDQEHISNLLDILAKRFEDGALDRGEGRWAWGQFLDTPKKDQQAGPYGTSAGLLILALAGRGESPFVKGAVKQIQAWWADRREGPSPGQDALYARERIAQTLRLAVMCLALRLCQVPEGQVTGDEIAEALFERILELGLWGDYWHDPDRNDPTPRHFTSAIVLLALRVLGDPKSVIDDRLLPPADRLESRLISVPVARAGGFGDAEAAAVSAAILTVKGRAVSRRARRRMSDLGILARHWRGERTAYFFNYEKPADDERRFRNGYFIVSPELLLAIAGLQPHAPAQLRLAAEHTLDVIKANIDQHGAYRADVDQLLPSMDQAWAGILLALARRYNGDVSGPARLRYQLRRERKENRFTAVAFPVIATAWVAAGNVLLTGASLGFRVFAVLALLIIGGLYGDIVKKVIGGRR